MRPGQRPSSLVVLLRQNVTHALTITQSFLWLYFVCGILPRAVYPAFIRLQALVEGSCRQRLRAMFEPGTPIAVFNTWVVRGLGASAIAVVYQTWKNIKHIDFFLKSHRFVSTFKDYLRPLDLKKYIKLELFGNYNPSLDYPKLYF